MKLIIKIDKTEERKYLRYIHENLDKKLDYTKFTKDRDISLIKDEWKKIEQKFLKFVGEYCKFKWDYKKYYAILSEVTSYSFSSPLIEHRNKILIDLKLGQFTNRIICHELLHAYFSQIYLGDGEKEGIIHELFVTHMLFNTNLKRLFKDGLTEKENLLWAGHKKQYSLYSMSKKIWVKKKDIQDYINKMSKKLKK